MTKLRAKQITRLLIAGVALIVSAGVVLVTVTVASAAEYNYLEAQGFYSNPEQTGSGVSAGVYIGGGTAMLLGAAGIAALLLALVLAIKGSQSPRA